MSTAVAGGPSSALVTALLAAPRPGGWAEARAAAEARLADQGLPTSAHEDWKYTDLKPLAALALQPAEALAEAMTSPLPELGGATVVFVNGRRVGPSPILAEGLSLGALTGPLHSEALGPFEALNLARFPEGVELRVARQQRVEAPLHLRFVTHAPAPVAVFPRLRVVLEAGASLNLVEEHLGEGTYLSCPVVEMVVGEGAILHHERVQLEAEGAFHLGSLRSDVARSGQYQSRTLSFGARLSRQEPRVRLAEGAEASLDGMALLDGHQVADTHSFLEHAEPHASSHQLHKCIVDGQGRAIFNGQIRVAAGAQGTDAKQQSRTLLLSEAARVDTKPQLEIYADDVKCSHGAAVGQLDPEELFYLQSRGLNADDARNLLTYGFAADVITRIPVTPLRRALRHLVLQRTRSGALGDLA